MRLVTVFCPLTTADTGKTVFQPAGETRLVVDCKVKVSPAALVGHAILRWLRKVKLNDPLMTSAGGQIVSADTRTSVAFCAVASYRHFRAGSWVSF